MILLVVDTQKGCFDERLYAFETVRDNIKRLIAVARENNVEVVYVQHDDGPGTELDKAADNYEIYDEFAPREEERCFEKNVNSAFHPMTGLTEYLQSKEEKDVITIGVSTDYCMDATIKSGFEKGFNMFVPSYTNSTYDNPYFDKETAYKFYNEFMWPKRYARCITVEEAEKLLQTAGSIMDAESSMEERFVVLDSAYLPEMAQLYKKTFGKEPWNDDWSDVNQLTEYIKEISTGYHPLNYGLLKDGNLYAVSIGQVKHWWQGTEYYLDELYVDPEYQGQGLGSRFLQMIEEDVKKRGLSGIFLQTDNDKPAYIFYQKRSFKELTGHVSFFKDIDQTGS